MNRDGHIYINPQPKAGFTGFLDHKKANVSGILNTIIENSINAVALSNAAKRLIYVNESFLRMWGYEATDEIIGRKIKDFWRFPEEAEAVVEKMLLTGGWVGELTARKKDGSSFIAQISASVERNEAGEISYLMGTFLDISDRKMAEQEFRESEWRFRTMADGTPLMIWVTDSEGRMEYVNSAYCQFFGITIQDVQADGWQQLVHPEDAPAYTTEFMACLKNQKPFEAQARVLRHDGQWRWVHSYGQPRLSPSKDCIGMTGSSPDITEQKLSQDALKKNEERFRVAQELSLDAFTILTAVRDEKGCIVDFRWEYVNPKAAQILRHKASELVGKRLLDILPGNKTEADLFERYIRVVETGEPHDYELRYESEAICGWFRNMTVRLDDGIATCFTDITDRKQAEKSIRQLSQFPEENPNPVLRASADGVLLYANISAKIWLAELGWKDGGPIPAPVRLLAEKFTTEGQVIQEEIKIPTTGKAFLISAIRPRGEGYINFYCMDITERERAEEAVQRTLNLLEQRVHERTVELKQRSEQLAKLSSQLTLTEQWERRRLASILHDNLQQILVGAKISSEILAAGIDPAKKKIAENVIELINQSLRISRSLTDELSPPVLQQGSLSAAFNWLSRWMWENNRFRVDLQVDSAIDPKGEDVTLLLFQSVRELLLNVIKHADATSARIEMTRTKDDALCVIVKDDGIGFDPETMWEKAKAGTGFGLFSIRERLELMGGYLEVESSPGKGASLSLVAPLEAKSCAGEDEKQIRKIIAKVHKAKRSKDKIRVLLVDDHTVVRQGLSTMLNLHSGVEMVGEAADGHEAVEKARKLQPDVILMDISMPRLNGIDATRIIHAELPHIRIIGLSMHDSQDQADRMMEAGASAYCTKDGAADVLLSAIRGE